MTDYGGFGFVDASTPLEMQEHEEVCVPLGHVYNGHLEECPYCVY